MAETRTRAEQYTRQIVGVLMDTTNSSVSSTNKKCVGVVDGTDKNHVSMMVEDLRNGLNRKIDSIKTDMLTCKQDQYQAHCAGMMKIPKATREMTVKEFNAKYKCNLLDLLQTAKSNATGQAVKEFPAPLCGKRDRFETPAPNRARPLQTPGTIIRTVRRGEQMYSRNGSPVDPVDEGALVATVTKKRRGNAMQTAAANFDINVGDGRYISLNDPTGVKHLDDNMKSNALTQLKVLQDQMASLMEQLTTKETK